MKRGLVKWDKSELPPDELAARLAAVHAVATANGVDAMLFYSDVWRSNDARYVSNYMPYWNRACVLAPRDDKPILLCSLSPRVYPWIKTVTVHETIIASPSLPAAFFKLCGERGFKKVGVYDLEGLPADVHAELVAGKVELVDIRRGDLHPAPSDVEVRMHARAARMAREVLEQELANASGQTDHQLTGRLERLLRRAGAEDVVVLVSDGQRRPLPAAGHDVGPHSSIVVAIEHNGHWAKVTRNVAGITARLPAPAGVTELREILSGPYSWEIIEDVSAKAVVSVQLRIAADSRHLYYGDTCLQGKEGLRVL